MAKFYGRIGYSSGTQEVKPGVFEDVIVERNYYGDVVRNSSSLAEGENIQKDLSLSNEIRVVADAYALDHYFAIKYVEWSGALWTVSSVEVQRPRLLLRLGEVYNGPIPDEAP